jgi:hypothetical protein
MDRPRSGGRTSDARRNQASRRLRACGLVAASACLLVQKSGDEIEQARPAIAH